MTSEQFAYWLQGFTELHGENPTPEQWLMIKDHLALVFRKMTPIRQMAAQSLPLSPSILTDPWWERQGQCSTVKSDTRTRSYC